jgi:glyoxylase-like metal-dependent hydrolase (beta-lactamase superfamily II)
MTDDPDWADMLGDDEDDDQEPNFGPHGVARIDHAIASGTFTLDDQTFDVDNNVWVIGDDAECVVIDAPHDVGEILQVIDGRRVIAILCSHGHDDHVRCAPELGRATNSRTLLHPDDLPVWHLTHRDPPGGPLRDNQRIPIAGIDLRVLHTPGHTPGSVCFYAEEFPGFDHGVVFTADTLFRGGPGATGGRSFSDHDQILNSIRFRLLTLPDGTVVNTGHGPETTIGAERGNF